MLGPNLLFFAIQPRVIMHRIFVLASHCCKYQFHILIVFRIVLKIFYVHLRINKASQFTTKLEVLEKAFSFNWSIKAQCFIPVKSVKTALTLTTSFVFNHGDKCPRDMYWFSLFIENWIETYISYLFWNELRCRITIPSINVSFLIIMINIIFENHILVQIFHRCQPNDYQHLLISTQKISSLSNL